MKRFLLCLILFSSYSFAAMVKLPDTKCLEAVSNFEGDRHSDFRNDFEALLCDGTVWKIHPQDRGLFSRWQLGDEIDTGVRTSHYFFKREHKFCLYNLTRNEEARVMLVRYSNMPLTISATQTDLVQERHVPRHRTDTNGHIQTTYHIERIYEKKLVLSDGSAWTLRYQPDFDSFTTGTTVYLGRDRKHEDVGFFLISGSEREAAWTKASW